jgi:hypothetical protein
LRPELRTRRQHAAGEDVLLDEIGAAPVRGKQVVADGDALDHRPAFRLQGIGHGAEIGRPPAFADGFEHFDGYHVVEAFRRIAVILQAQIRRRNALLRPGQLRRREREAGDGQPVVCRHFGETAPAAADLEHALARFGGEAAEDAPVLGVLRSLQRLVGCSVEQRRRVTHAGIEPQPIEVVAQVVMRHDVAFAAGAAVAVEPVAQTGGQELSPRAIDRVAQGVPIARQKREQRGDIGRIPFAVEVGFGQADVALGQHAREDGFVIDLHGHARLAFPEQETRAVGQADLQQAATDFLEQRKHESRIAAQAPVAGQGQGGLSSFMASVLPGEGWRKSAAVAAAAAGRRGMARP